MTSATSCSLRSATIFRADLTQIVHRTDRMFFWLLLAQWASAVLIAAVWSPRTWIAQYWSVHKHIFAAAVLGGLFAAYPLYLIRRHPGTRYTRHMIAIGQMLQSALLVHVTGGRIETHFHVFGSLALLAFYRDWPVLLTASAVVYFDHLALGFWFPLSVYGVWEATIWRSLEHAFWVLFEVSFLTLSCRTGILELRAIAEREAQLEEATADLQRLSVSLREAIQHLETRVAERTDAVQQTNQHLATKLREVEVLNRIMMDREDRILELKEEIRRLRGAPLATGAATPEPG